jgi:hypothetical protein
MKDFKIGKYRHYKGGIYDVLALGLHTETEELLVMYADSEKRIWARPYVLFIERIMFYNKEQKRFEYVGDETQF